MAAWHHRLLGAVTRLLLAGAARLLSARHADWADAMRAEVLAVADTSEAFRYAWGCFTASLRQSLRVHLATAVQPDRLGLVCASITVLAGCVFMRMQDAPARYAWVNGLALALAWATFALLPRQRLQRDATCRALATFVLGALMLAAVPASAASGASGGWLRLGPVAVQPAWLLCPALWGLSVDVARPGRLARAVLQLPRLAGLLMSLAALAAWARAELLAVAAVLWGVQACRARSAADAGLAVVALALAADTVARWTAPAPLAFVDGVLQQAFAQGVGPGLLLSAAALVLLLPGLVHRQARDHGAVWAALLALSLPGWLPTPLLGFGSSFILGYVLSLVAWPDPEPVRPPPPAPRRDAGMAPPSRARPA